MKLKRASCVVVGAFVAGCHATYLPPTTLSRTAPLCGAHAIAARAGDAGPTYFACQVDSPVVPPADRYALYPRMMAEANVETMVIAQFAVDENGRVDVTTVRTTSPHEVFTKSVLESLVRWRAAPARRRGRPVRQLTTHAFCFVLSRSPNQFDERACDVDRSVFALNQVTWSCADGSTTRVRSELGCTTEPPPPARPEGRCPGR